VIDMNGCGCGCGCRSGFAWRPTRDERIEWLEEYQRDLQQHAAEVADELKNLRERPQPAT